MFHISARSLENAADELPWPVKFTMVRYRHVHIFENRGPPSRRSFVRDLASLEQKFKRRAELRQTVGEEGLKWAKHKMYDVAKFHGVVAQAMRVFLNGLRHTAVRAFNQGGSSTPPAT